MGRARAPVEATAPARLAKATPPPVILDPAFRKPPKRPHYPRIARRLGQEGKVAIQALVGERGTTQRLRIVASSRYPALDEAARQAVRQWEFKPARWNGRAIQAWVQVSVDFVLE
jgi:protein TonB